MLTNSLRRATSFTFGISLGFVSKAFEHAGHIGSSRLCASVRAPHW
jgi:hypothetical protein